MVCSNTSTKGTRRREQGATLVEFLIATLLGGLVLGGILVLVLYSARAFAGMANYVDLDGYSRNALDVITKDIRQADTLLPGADSQNMTFRFTSPTNAASTWTVQFVYNPDARTLTRVQGTQRAVLLRECDFLNFSYFQRNPIGGSYEQFPSGTPVTCKLVQMSWVCSRRIMQQRRNTESVQSAKVVIRKQ